MIVLKILFAIYSFILGVKLSKMAKEFGLLYASLLTLGFWLSGWIVYGFLLIIIKALGF